MNVDTEEKKCTRATPAPPKTPPDTEKKTSPEITSPDTKQTQNNDSPKQPPIKALFQQTPKISSRHAINTAGDSATPRGTPAPPPARSKASAAAIQTTITEASQGNSEKNSAAKNNRALNRQPESNPNHGKDQGQQLNEVKTGDPTQPKPTEHDDETQRAPPGHHQGKPTTDPSQGKVVKQNQRIQTTPQQQGLTSLAEEKSLPEEQTTTVTANQDDGNRADQDMIATKPTPRSAGAEQPAQPQSEKEKTQHQTVSKEQQAQDGQETTPEAGEGTLGKLVQDPKKPEMENSEARCIGGDAMEVEIGITGNITATAANTEAEATETTEADISDSGQHDPKPSRMISYYEWKTKHHKWLNAMMRQALGEKEAPEPPHILNLRYPVRPEPDHNVQLEPWRKYTIRYEMRIVVAEATNLVEAYRQALIEWFNKVLEVDSDAVIYPWTGNDRQAGTTTIEDPDELPASLSSLKKYTPKAWIRLKGGTIYPKILVGLNMDPATLVEDISWWLQSTKQGMWPSQLQDAEETVCLGWLLYSTDELDKEALRKEIWQMTGVQVALRYRAIDDGVPKRKAADANKEGKEKSVKPTAAPVKALHLEINVSEPYASRRRVETIFSSTAEVFPLDIKLRLVRDARLLTNPMVKAKATSLRSLQQRFGTQMESCLTWEIATLDLPDKTLQANLRQLILAIPDPDYPHQKLFHSVSKTFTEDGHIFRYHPSKSQHAWGVVTGLLVFLKGMWSEQMDTKKFHKFFNEGAIDRATDSWWDTETKCVITRADAEMENILHQDDDYHFPEMKIEVEIPQEKKKAKEDDGLLSTGSYSTFCTMATAKPKKQTNQGKKVQIATPSTAKITDQQSVITMNTLSEQSFTQLVESVVAAIQANHISTSTNSAQASPGGPKTGQPK